MKPKYKDIDWDKMWEIFPEAQAFACDEDRAFHWFDGQECQAGDFLWLNLDGVLRKYIGKYDLGDTNWKDTLVTRPKPKSKMEMFAKRALECEKKAMKKRRSVPAIVFVEIAKEIFGVE